MMSGAGADVLMLLPTLSDADWQVWEEEEAAVKCTASAWLCACLALSLPCASANPCHNHTGGNSTKQIASWVTLTSRPEMSCFLCHARLLTKRSLMQLRVKVLAVECKWVLHRQRLSPLMRHSPGLAAVLQ